MSFRSTFIFAVAITCCIIYSSFILPAQDTGKASVQRGKKVYEQYCLACHQSGGEGVPRLNPPLIKNEYVLGDKNRLIRIVIKGLNEPIEIDGEEYYNPMPAQPQLTNQQVADVLSYVRSSFGNKASLVTLTEVESLRVKLK